MTGSSPRATVRTVRGAAVAAVPLGVSGSQQLLLGGPTDEPSPHGPRAHSDVAGDTSPLIAHDASEVAYVLGGLGWMVTGGRRHPSGARLQQHGGGDSRRSIWVEAPRWRDWRPRPTRSSIRLTCQSIGSSTRRTHSSPASSRISRKRSIDRMNQAWPTATLVHLPVHGSTTAK